MATSGSIKTIAEKDVPWRHLSTLDGTLARKHCAGRYRLDNTARYNLERETNQRERERELFETDAILPAARREGVSLQSTVVRINQHVQVNKLLVVGRAGGGGLPTRDGSVRSYSRTRRSPVSNSLVSDRKMLTGTVLQEVRKSTTASCPQRIRYCVMMLLQKNK